MVGGTRRRKKKVLRFDIAVDEVAATQELECTG
jgi:hypothetical protein